MVRLGLPLELVEMVAVIEVLALGDSELETEADTEVVKQSEAVCETEGDVVEVPVGLTEPLREVDGVSDVDTLVEELLEETAVREEETLGDWEREVVTEFDALTVLMAHEVGLGEKVAEWDALGVEELQRVLDSVAVEDTVEVGDCVGLKETETLTVEHTEAEALREEVGEELGQWLTDGVAVCVEERDAVTVPEVLLEGEAEALAHLLGLTETEAVPHNVIFPVVVPVTLGLLLPEELTVPVLEAEGQAVELGEALVHLLEVELNVADREAEELPDTEEVAEGEGERELLVLGLTLVLSDFDAVGLTETEELVEGERTGDRVLEAHLDALLQPDAVVLPDALREGELLTLGEALNVEHTDSVGESVGVTVTEADLLGLALLLGEEDELGHLLFVADTVLVLHSDGDVLPVTEVDGQWLALLQAEEERDPLPLLLEVPQAEKVEKTVELALWLPDALEQPDGLIERTDVAVDDGHFEAEGLALGHLEVELLAVVLWETEGVALAVLHLLGLAEAVCVEE